MNNYTEDMKKELSAHEYRNPPVTDLQMEAMANYHKENSNTKSERENYGVNSDIKRE